VLGLLSAPAPSIFNRKRKHIFRLKILKYFITKVADIFEMYNCDIRFFHHKLYDKVMKTIEARIRFIVVA
jgi:hypothetical protein